MYNLMPGKEYREDWRRGEMNMTICALHKIVFR